MKTDIAKLLELLLKYLAAHSDAFFALIGIFLGITGTLIASWLSDKRAIKRDEADRLFNERKEIYSELVFQLRELYLSSQGYNRPDMTKHKINHLIHKATFFATSWSLRHRLPVIAALVEMKELSKDTDHEPTKKTLSELNEILPKDIKDMEDEMRRELGILEK